MKYSWIWDFPSQTTQIINKKKLQKKYEGIYLTVLYKWYLSCVHLSAPGYVKSYCMVNIKIFQVMAPSDIMSPARLL